MRVQCCVVASLLLLAAVVPARCFVPPCARYPMMTCCHDAVIRQCGAYCADYISDNCPDKQAKNLAVQESEQSLPVDESRRRIDDKAALSEQAIGDDLQNSSSQTGEQCGVAPNWRPCIEKRVADQLFLQCCYDWLPSQCWSVCSYEIDEVKARNTLVDAVTKKRCGLKYISPLLYCASQYRNNVQCCQDLGMADESLKVGDRCLRMCDIAENGGIREAINYEDLVCLANWNVLMYCHHSGLDF